MGPSMLVGQISPGVSRQHVLIGADGMLVREAGIILIGTISISLNISHRRGESRRDR